MEKKMKNVKTSTSYDPDKKDYETISRLEEEIKTSDGKITSEVKIISGMISEEPTVKSINFSIYKQKRSWRHPFSGVSTNIRDVSLGVERFTGEMEPFSSYAPIIKMNLNSPIAGERYSFSQDEINMLFFEIYTSAVEKAKNYTKNF